MPRLYLWQRCQTKQVACLLDEGVEEGELRVYDDVLCGCIVGQGRALHRNRAPAVHREVASCGMHLVAMAGGGVP